jgi:hypothetical protein
MPEVTQDDVDAVAAYVEAARELRESPFFGEDESTSWMVDPRSKGGIAQAKFGSGQVLTAMVLPFRRIWMQKEPSYFFHVYNILRKHCPNHEMNRQMDGIRADYVRYRDQWQLPPRGVGCDQTPKQIINLWLNNRLAHTEKDPVKAKAFRRLCDQIGEAKIEGLFRTAALSMGCCYINLLQVAETALAHWAEHDGIAPSRPLGEPLSRNGTVGTADGTVIVRRQPHKETAQQIVERLLARSSLSQLALVVQHLSIPTEERTDRLLGASSIRSLIEGSGCSVDEAPYDSAESRQRARTFASWCDPTPWQGPEGWTIRKGWVGMPSLGRFLVGGDAMDLLEEEFHRFKSALSDARKLQEAGDGGPQGPAG